VLAMIFLLLYQSISLATC